MRVRQIPCLGDNYCHLIIDEETGSAAIVDPANGPKIAAVLHDEKVTLTHILCTHHHWDHTGGIPHLLDEFADLQVVAGAQDAERIKGTTLAVLDGQRFAVGELEAQVIDVPCHTRGHIAFLFDGALFSGDTLFVAGCGRFFEGDAAQMHKALNLRFAVLPPETKVYCGHEYTVSNLRFAQSLEPDNPALRAKLLWATAQCEAGPSTVPSTIGEELTTNPFMRLNSPEIQAATGATRPVQVMQRLRELKNAF